MVFLQEVLALIVGLVLDHVVQDRVSAGIPAVQIDPVAYQQVEKLLATLYIDAKQDMVIHRLPLFSYLLQEKFAQLVVALSNAGLQSLVGFVLYPALDQVVADTMRAATGGDL